MIAVAVSRSRRLSTWERKRQLREVALLKRRSIDPARLAELSSNVLKNLVSLPEYQRARQIISYVAKPDEVQTRPIVERALEDGKRVAAIVTNVTSRTLSFHEIGSFEEDLVPGPFGILEPIPSHSHPIAISEADMILVPLVAWDEQGHRLGYGAGYFDRSLAGATGVRKVGLALESQRIPHVPESRLDVPLDVIVTDTRVVRPRRLTKAFKNRQRPGQK